MTYYLNNNFRGESKFNFNDNKIIKAMASSITKSDREDIIYLVGKQISNSKSFVDLKIYIFRSDILKIECIYKGNIEVVNPEMKCISFNKEYKNTIVYSFNLINSNKQKEFYIIFDGEKFNVIEKKIMYI